MHYATQSWTDYVRGLAPKALAADMQQHLSSGCERCNRTVLTLSKLVKVASQPEIDVPNFVIHKAKAIFSLPRKSFVARIVFDSFLQPLPAGVRSRANMCRQAMFEAGDVLVDVRLQNDADGKILITGQVADKARPNRSASRLQLHLVSGDTRQPLAANRFGEFQTIYAATSDLRLEISGTGRNIEVPLCRLNDATRPEAAVTALDFVLPE